MARPYYVEGVSHLPTELARAVKGWVEMLQHRRAQYSVGKNFDEALVSAIQSLTRGRVTPVLLLIVIDDFFE